MVEDEDRVPFADETRAWLGKTAVLLRVFDEEKNSNFTG